jgi:hypothetical protein
MTYELCSTLILQLIHRGALVRLPRSASFQQASHWWEAKCTRGERAYKNEHPLSSMHFFNRRGSCRCTRARLRGHIEPLQKSSQRCSTLPYLLSRLSPSPLPKCPLSRCATRGQGASNRPSPSRFIELPPQPRASAPQVAFPR